MSFRFSNRMKAMNGTETREIFALLKNPKMISFAGGLPAKDCLPIEDIAKITNDIVSSSDFNIYLQYGITEGIEELRYALLDYVKDAGILNQKIDNCLVISGGQQGIDLLCKAMLEKDDVVLVEDPTYLAVLQIFNSYEAKAVGVKTAKDGLDLDDLENKMIQLKPKMLYVVPTFSNPTGKSYSLENRKKIVSLAQKHKVVVLEDDPYSKLRFSGNDLAALKSFDTQEWVVYISSFSKTLSPGLRMGVAIGNHEIIRKMAVGKQGTDLHTSNLSQKITLEYLKRDLLQPNIKKSIPIYKMRKDAMVTAIKKYMPQEFIHTDPEGGLFIWGEFPNAIDTEKIFHEAIVQNVAYIKGSVFYADGKSGKSALRLNFSNETPERIEEGIAILGKLFQEKLNNI